MNYPQAARLLQRLLDELAGLYDAAPELMDRAIILREYEAARLALRALDRAIADWHWRASTPAAPDPLLYVVDGQLKRRPRRQTMQSLREGLAAMHRTLSMMQRDHPTLDAYRDTAQATRALRAAITRLADLLTARHGPRSAVNPRDMES